MLVLTRRPGEGDKSTIMIGVDIAATLIGVRGEQVSLNYHIHRSETGGATSGLMSAR